MYFDALTLSAVVDELRAAILGGRIQRVLQPSPLSIALEIYGQRQRHHLIASAHPQLARVHLVQAKPSRGVEQATPLLLLLRKYVLGGRIVAVEQPPLERLLMLSIVKESDSGNSETDISDSQPTGSDPEYILHSELIIEPMDRRSNIILVDDDNIILESVKRVTSRMSSRVILPRQPYETPPAQEKRDPRTATAQGIESLRELDMPELVRALVAGYRGVSPLAAREIEARALGRSGASINEPLPWETIAACMRGLFCEPWQPCIVQEDEEPRAYAPYALTHLRAVRSLPSINQALETFYAARETLTTHHQRRDAVQQQLETARQRLDHQRSQIVNELEHVEDLERLRWEGEMIFAFLHTLTPGQTTLEVEGHTIELQADQSPVEQAQARFRRYQRARTGRASLQERLQETEARIAGLEQLSALLEVAEERDQIEQIAYEAEEQGYIAAPGKGKKESAKQDRQKRRFARRKPLRLVSSDGYDIYVGRSAAQNIEVTFRIGRPDDLWLHVRVIPGAHVIVRSGGHEVPATTLREAAGLAAYFSRARAESTVEVDISRRKLVRKVAVGPPGLVTYRAERTLKVPPLPPWA